MTELTWSPKQACLLKHGSMFDPWHLQWTAGETEPPADAESVSPSMALLYLAERKALRRVPVGIIGPREASPRQYELAEKLGEALAIHGLQLLCGGKTGVMEAACRGHATGGGLPLGILPDEEWQGANPYVAIPVATGIGPARNAIIARACLALVAIGGGPGTLSEMALGMQFGRLVLAMDEAPEVKGVDRIASVEEALARIATRIFM